MHLYPHQRELLELNPDIHLLAHGTGAGKTLMALELAKKKGLWYQHPVLGKLMNRVLIICPKHLKEKWERDVAGFPFPVVVLTKEQFKKEAPTLPDYSIVIVDEAHTFAGMTSQLHKSLLKYFTKWGTPYRFLLTASPYLSTPWNIYALGKLCNLPLNYAKFRETFFVEILMGHRHVWKPREGKQYKELLRKIVNRIGSSVQLTDVFDVPAQRHETVMLELTPEQAAEIKKVYDPVAIVQWTREHQVENGYLPDIGRIKDSKTQWIKDFVKDNKKFVIFARYLEQIKVIKDALKKDKHLVLEIHGDVLDRDAVIRNANKHEEVVLIVQAQCSEGYELPTFNKVVYASMSFSYKDLIQSQGRVLRANALHENDYYYLVIEGGVDEEVYKAMGNKQDFSFALLERR